MLDRKIILPEALSLLSLIMRTCPATILNGGEHARKHLEILCEKGKEVTGCELRAGIPSLKVCDCEGQLDVYTDLLMHTKGEQVSRKDIMNYFGGNVHAVKIFETACEDFPEEYALKIVYGHLLVPVSIVDANNGIVVDENQNLSFGILKFPDLDFANGEKVAMHYGFLVDKITKEEEKFISACNSESELFRKTRNILHKNNGEFDFRKMHYYPRSKRIAEDQ